MVVVTMKMFALTQKDISAVLNAIGRCGEKHLQRCQVVLNIGRILFKFCLKVFIYGITGKWKQAFYNFFLYELHVNPLLGT